MSRAHPPELKKYLDKTLSIKLNGNRKVSGILRGFDPFMNLVLDEATEVNRQGSKVTIGMIVIRGNAIDHLEALDRIS